MSITIPIEKKEGKFNLIALNKYFQVISDGIYRVEVKKAYKPRSNDQNAYLWGVCYPFLLQGLRDAGWGELTSCEDVHNFFKQIFLKRSLTNTLTGELVELGGSSSTMTTQEFSTYIEALKDYSVEYLGIELPEPLK